MLVLIAFFGQAMAGTTMSCEHMSTSSTMSMMDHSTMLDTDVSHGEMMSVNGEASSKMDCCQEQCKCPVSGCISLSVIVDTRINPPELSEQKILQLSSLHQSQPNTSLYRPPIS
jgi:hypothetical protein